MVVVDVRDHSCAEVERIGRVEPAAEADLAHEQVDPRCHVCQCQHRQHLELSGLAELGGDVVEGLPQIFEGRDEFVFADRLPVDLDSLCVRDQVRLRHEPDPVAGGLEDGRQADTGRPLAVRAGDQRALEPSIRCTQVVQDRAGALGAELHPEAPEPGHVVDRLEIGHVGTCRITGAAEPRPGRCS